MPDRDSRSSLTYRLSTWLLFPGAFLYTLGLAIKHRNKQYFLQRLGYYTTASKQQQSIWLHCASVGEINTALPLIKTLINNHAQLLISTNTITGMQTLSNAKLENCIGIYMPLDYTAFANRLIDTFKPKVFLIFETELWPNIFHTTQRVNIPAAILNGRLSKKTLQAPEFLRKEYRKILNKTKIVLASSQSNAQNFTALGTNKVSILDNLKFATTKSEQKITKNPLPFEFLLCASTHEDEEIQLAKAWQQHGFSDYGLVLAPRHPKRIKDICQQFTKEKIKYVLHSHQPKNISAQQVYIIDTLGELNPFMAHAHIVFMGGSLVPIGGHNVLEPASLHRCILIGPHYQNLTEIIEALSNMEGILILDSAIAIMRRISKLRQDDLQRIHYANNAKNFVDSKKNVLHDYANAVQTFVQEHSL